MPPIPALTVGLFFWLVSPESLRLLGNGAAMPPAACIPAVVFFAAVAAAGAYFAGSPRKKTAADRRIDLPATTGLAGIVGTTLFAATGILVTAGFTFNEVFVHSFPNFGFAFFLLGLITLLQVFAPGRADTVQALLAGATLACLAVLVVAGLLVMLREPPPAPVYQAATPALALPLALCFIGFEQAGIGARPRRDRLLLFLFVGVVVLLLAWMTVSGLLVAPRRLLASSVPYMTASSGMAGQTGRMIMGLAIICGSLAAVNGLFSASRAVIAGTFSQNPESLCMRGAIAAVGMAIGLFMGLGLAGYEILETLIEAGLILWLLHGSLRVLDNHERVRSTGAALAGRLVGLLLALVAASLLVLHDSSWVIGGAAVCLLAGSSLCIIIRWLACEWSARRRKTG